jgi:hypothetical protein
MVVAMGLVLVSTLAAKHESRAKLLNMHRHGTRSVIDKTDSKGASQALDEWMAELQSDLKPMDWHTTGDLVRCTSARTEELKKKLDEQWWNPVGGFPSEVSKAEGTWTLDIGAGAGGLLGHKKNWNSNFKFGSRVADDRVKANGYQRIVLASFPNGGNHWVREMVEKMSGFSSASIHHDGGSHKLSKEFHAYIANDSIKVGAGNSALPILCNTRGRRIRTKTITKTPSLRLCNTPRSGEPAILQQVESFTGASCDQVTPAGACHEWRGQQARPCAPFVHHFCGKAERK